MNQLTIQERQRVLVGLKDMISAQSFVTGCLSSLDNIGMSKMGIDFIVDTDKGSVNFKASWTKYPPNNIFYRTESNTGERDGVFDSKSDYVIQVFGDNTIMIFNRDELVCYLEKSWNTHPEVTARGGITGNTCRGKLVSLEMLRNNVKTYTTFRLPKSVVSIPIDRKSVV
jgi:hypothetical protein